MNSLKIFMSPKEIKMIEKYLTPEMVVLEYGSGGSTLHFSTLTKEYHSIEHNREWFNRVRNSAAEKINMKIYLIDINKDQYGHGSRNIKNPIVANSWDQLENSTRYKIFEEYIKYPMTLDICFDACLIDGRARPECAKYIYDFLKPGTYVFIHDYWIRNYYHVVEEKYKVVDGIKHGQGLVVLQK